MTQAATRVQRVFAHLDWITPLTPDFLHVWISAVGVSPLRPTADDVASAVERAKRAWADVQPFDLGLQRINCFHDAVVAEAVGDGPRELVTRLVDAGLGHVELDTFLPHLTLGVFEPGNPAPLREVLAPLRETDLGRQYVTEATLCLLRSSRTTILDPWEAVGSVRFAAT